MLFKTVHLHLYDMFTGKFAKLCLSSTKRCKIDVGAKLTLFFRPTVCKLRENLRTKCVSVEAVSCVPQKSVQIVQTFSVNVAEHLIRHFRATCKQAV